MITFNYKEGMTTITFDDLKAALDGKNMGSDLDCLTAPDSDSSQTLDIPAFAGFLYF